MAFNVADLFLLRIHKSAESFDADFLYGSLNRPDVYTAEMLFLQHLKKRGLNVQTPVADKNGNYVCSLDDGTLVTLLTWLDGRNPADCDLTENFCRQYGQLVAQLHNTSVDFEHNSLLQYDDKLCNVLLLQVKTAHSKGYFNNTHYTTLLKLCNIIKIAFAVHRHSFVAVHGDLSLSNTLITPSGLALIDFSLCGYGHPMLDVSCVYSFVTEKKLQKAFNEGYESCGRAIDNSMIGICYAFNELMGILIHIDRLATESWFTDWLDKMCQKIFIPVISNKEPLWTELNE